MEFDSKFWHQPDAPDLQRQVHLIEAACATRFESGHQVELQLGHYCNNRCVFCVSGQLTEEGAAQPLDAAPILEALEASAEKGIRKVTFLGGEPTIQPSFLPSLERAVALGFDEIVIFTNGARGADHAWIERVRALGRFTWRLSLQGANAQAHEAVTRRKRSWRRLISLISALSERGEELTANMCLTTQSLPSLPEFPALLHRYGITQLHIDMIRPNNAGQRSDDELRAMMPRHSEVAPVAEEMLAGFDRLDPNFDVGLGNFPYCQLPARAHQIQHGGEPTLTLTTGHRGELDRLLKKYDYQRIDAVFAEGCDACAFRPWCRGVPERYAALYGTGELTPLSVAELRALDPDQNAFAVTGQALLGPLLGEAPPAPFTQSELSTDMRARRVDLLLSDGDGRALTFAFTPAQRAPRDAAAPLLIARRFHTHLSTQTGTRRADLSAAVSWLRAALGQLDGVGPVRLAASTKERERDLARLARWTRALSGARQYGAWRLGGRRRSDTQPGVAFRFDGPEGATLTLTLSQRADGRIAAAFSLGPDTARALADPLVTHLRALLAGA